MPRLYGIRMQHSSSKEIAMGRSIAAVVAGFVLWLVCWFLGEKLITAVWPFFGVQQAAFEAALTKGAPFSPEAPFLLTHLVLSAIGASAAGFLSERIAGSTSRPALALCIVLTALAVVKAAMSWTLVPLWYHIGFTVIVMVMTLVGGRLAVSKAVA
jgi:hypothetical protein